MLESLHISNYALIDNIDIEFFPGLNIITGETGAGKSIMLGALSLLLGGRADTKAICRTDRKSVIEASFATDGVHSLDAILAEADIDAPSDGHCILRREISPAGRSRAFVNDSPVNISTLQLIGLRLIDIHSQHQNQLLSQPDFQRDIIDSIADNAQRLADYRVVFQQFKDALRKYKTTKAAIARDSDNADFMLFQLKQLDQLDPAEGELDELEADLEQYTAQAETKEAVEAAAEALSEGEYNVIDLLTQVQDSCAELEDELPPDDNIAQRLEATLVELNDIADTINQLNSRLSADPADIEYTSRRIRDIKTAMRKHHAESDRELIAIRQKLQAKLDRIADSEPILEALEADARAARRTAMEAAKVISDARKKAAEEFAGLLIAAASPLGMKNLQCQIDVSPAEISATGIDNVEFRFAFNKNQELIPVSGAASGGEISRLMLSIKAIIADKIELPSIVFDEVDTGVSGDVASRMGSMMKDISSAIQVIAITHLPQVAAKGTYHYKVYKADDEDSTHTHINRLTPQQRIDELALMLAGDPSNAAARANAEDLLRTAAAK